MTMIKSLSRIDRRGPALWTMCAMAVLGLALGTAQAADRGESAGAAAEDTDGTITPPSLGAGKLQLGGDRPIVSASAGPQAPTVAGCPITALPNDGSTSANERAPNLRNRFGRSVYLIKATELAAAGITSGMQFSAIGWNFSTAPALSGANNLIVYMQNTADTTNTKSTTWATAISGMTVVNASSPSVTIPNVTGGWDIPLSAGASFTYTGGGLYIAFDASYPSGTLSTTTVVLCNSTGLTNGLLGAQGTTAPTTLAASSFRPETRLTPSVATVLNDLSVDYVVSYGSLAQPLVGAQTVKAVIRNTGVNPLASGTTTLNISGADTFSDTKPVPALAACGGTATVSFSPFTPGAIGSDVVNVTVPADDVAGNNSLSRPLDETYNLYSYKHPSTTAAGGVGLTSATGAFVAKFNTTQAAKISAVNLEFAATSATTYRVAIYGDASGVPSTTALYVDAADRTVAAAGPVTITLPSPVAVGPGNFYVGIQQTNTTNASLSFDNESPIRSGAFYLATPNPPASWIDFAPGNNFKLNIGATLIQCTTAADCNDGNACTDDACTNQLCSHTNNDANACSDGNACTTGDACVAGSCIPGVNPCNDNNACTNDVCDGQGGCTYPPVNCDDANPCTDDSCSPASGCAHANNTSTCSDGNPCTLGDVCSGGACVPGAPPAGSVQVCNNGTITIPTVGAATPYPVAIVVSGQQSYLCSATVNLNGITHTFPDDIDVLLAGPGAQNAIIMSDVGGSTAVTNVNLTLSDAAASSIPDAGPLVSGTFKPTNIGTGDVFPAPAPTPLGGSALSIFTGTNPNGTWNLWVDDQFSPDGGSMSGWCLNLVTVCAGAADCNDNNVCTDDACVGGVCTHANNTNACDDGNPCTAPDVCSGGACVPGVNPCNDNDACTNDICGSGGSCTYTPVNCDDANPCTDDACSTATGCSHVNNTAACSDGNQCTIGDVCSGGTCVPGAPPAAVQFCNNAGISIPSSGASTPYPSTIAVTGGPVVCSVTVNLNGITHTFPDDIDVLLAGPAGQNAIVMSDVGGSTAASGVNLTLDDAAANSLPDSGGLSSGTFKPTNSGTGDTFAAPAPAPLGGSALSIFNGSNPNGNWDLWVVDDASGDLGSMTGWCVNVRSICGTNADCSDNNPCTDDACVAGACTHTNNASSCDDGNACTANDTCTNGACVGGAPPSCDDGDACTADSCNTGTGQCDHVAVVCNDNNPCTDDVCVSPTGCAFTPNDGNACSDNDSCTQTDACVNGACVGGNPVNCDDANVCTTDSCVPATGLCDHANNTNACDDGNACTTGDVCAPALGQNFDLVTAPDIPDGWTSTLVTGNTGDLSWYTDVVTPDTAPNTAFGEDPDHITDNTLDSPPVTIASASAKLTFRNRFSLESTFDGAVLEISIGGGPFTDIVTAGGSFASGGYTGTISSSWGSPIGGRSAWTGASTGYPAYITTIVNLPASAAGQSVVLRWRVASDSSVSQIGQDIDTIVLVDPTNTCTGTPADCDDNNPCTNDSCDPQSGQCVHTNNTDACDDGNACTNGDACSGGTCQGGTPTVCNDGNPCTDEVCDPQSGACVPSANSAPCDDGNACTVGDTCALGSCQPGTAITAPPEVAGLVAAADKATYSWSAALYATGYGAVRGSVAALPVGPGGGDEVCLGGLGSPALVDATVPAAGSSFFYLVRGENACGIGTYGTQSNGTPRVTTTCP